MIPAAFDYERAETVGDAVGALQRHGDGAKLLAGGHSLIPMMKLRLAAPEVLVDIGGISRPARHARDAGDALAIGALTRHDEVARRTSSRRGCPVLAEAAGGIGDRQVRDRGTIGGAIAHADPHGDLPAVLLALEADRSRCRAPNGARTIAASDLFLGFLTTALAPDEILTEVRVPKLRRAAPTSSSTGGRRTGRSSACAPCGRLRRCGSRSPARDLRPVRATAAEQAFTGSNAAEAAELAAEGLTPTADVAGSAEYRRHLVKVLTKRALEAAARRLRHTVPGTGLRCRRERRSIRQRPRRRSAPGRMPRWCRGVRG